MTKIYKQCEIHGEVEHKLIIVEGMLLNKCKQCNQEVENDTED